MGKDSHFTGQPVYSQVLKLLDKEKILQICHNTEGSEAYVKRFDGYQHLVVMLFGVLKHFDSLRELEIGMKAEAHKLSHLGMDYLVRRSTLAEANIRRPQEFFASVYAYLLEKYARFLADSQPPKSYKGQTHEPKDWEKLLYMMDSTTISLFDNILKGVGRHSKLLLSAKHDLSMPNLFITSGWAYLFVMTSPLIHFPSRLEALQLPVQA